LDFHDEFTIPAGIHSVYNIVQSCFRIKANKFENSYEMFCSILDEDFDPKKPTTEELRTLSRSVAFDQEKSEWTVKPIIDHGS
jgi:hypothetical protein